MLNYVYRLRSAQMTLAEMQALMASIKDRLARGEISRAEAEKLRAPIRQQILRDGRAPN